MASIPVALQLFTVRDETAKDFIGTLQRVAQIGYKGVEFAGFGGLSASEVKRVLDDLGLRAAGSHTGINALEADLAAVADFNLAIGNPYVVVPWMPQEYRADAAGWRAVGAKMNELGAQLQRRGLTLCYHNHAFEFERFDGAYGLDIFYGASDPALVQAELDLYWVKKGGEDPAAYVRKYAGRVPLLHIKDMAGDAEGSFTEFGTGIIDWGAVFAIAPSAGAQWYIVEQDACTRPCMESVQISFDNLRQRGMA